MTEFYKFASENTYFVVGILALMALCAHMPFQLANRWIRHRNIVAQGWPPPHLDADGNFRPDDETQHG